jgi:hypothetical protein
MLLPIAGIWDVVYKPQRSGGYGITAVIGPSAWDTCRDSSRRVFAGWVANGVTLSFK